jgi:hypothetical protein
MKQGFSLMDWNILTGRPQIDFTQGEKQSLTRQITQLELRQHKSWTSIRNKVYDISQYYPYHPGLSDELERGIGDDSTLLFEEFHPWVNIDAMMKRCQVGILVPDPLNDYVYTSKCIISSRKYLDAGHFYRIRMEITDERFMKQLKHLKETQVLFHVKVKCKLGNAQRFIERPYTPLIGNHFDEQDEPDNDSGITLLVKRSLRNNRPCLSHPLCKLEATPDEFHFEVQLKPCMLKDDWYRNASSIGMVCAGSGITPALQILSRQIEDTNSQKRLYLVWCNRDDKHVALKKELNTLIAKFKGRLTAVHLFSRLDEAKSSLTDDSIDYEIGRFDEEFLTKRPDVLPVAPKTDNIKDVSILICGTWDFEKSVRATMFMAGFSPDALIRIPG